MMYVLVRSVWCVWVVLAGEEGAIGAAAIGCKVGARSAFVHARPIVLILIDVRSADLVI